MEQGLSEIPGGYEVVCPNSVLGCTYIGNLDVLQKHLVECLYSGQTVQQEQEERLLVKQHVIRQQEEERARRVRFDENVIVKRSKPLAPVEDSAITSVEPLRPPHTRTGKSDFQLDSDVSDVEASTAMNAFAGVDIDSSECSDGGGGRPRPSSRRKALLQRYNSSLCMCML